MASGSNRLWRIRLGWTASTPSDVASLDYQWMNLLNASKLFHKRDDVPTRELL